MTYIHTYIPWQQGSQQCRPAEIPKLPQAFSSSWSLWELFQLWSNGQVTYTGKKFSLQSLFVSQGHRMDGNRKYHKTIRLSHTTHTTWNPHDYVGRLCRRLIPSLFLPDFLTHSQELSLPTTCLILSQIPHSLATIQTLPTRRPILSSPQIPHSLATIQILPTRRPILSFLQISSLTPKLLSKPFPLPPSYKYHTQ